MTSLNNTLTQERLKQVLHYDHETGVFTWLVKSAKNIKAGDAAGCFASYGYRRIKINRVMYRAHRIAWLYVYGAFPAAGIDHINGNKADNRLANLREANQAENNQNRKSHRNGSSKYLGVCWSKTAKKWRAKIQANRKSYHLGYFVAEEGAHAAYCEAKLEHHRFNPVARDDN